MLNIIPNWKYNSWLFSVILLICFVFSAAVRYQQFLTWEKTPSIYFVGERPMMTTLDAPHWLFRAREYNEGLLEGDRLRNYPDYVEIVDQSSIPNNFKDQISLSSNSNTSEIKFTEVPLLSFLIANLAPLFNHNYYLAGTLLIPVLASLFILPLGIYFLQIGIPVSGLLGGLIGSFAAAYYVRSSIGRIDTDMLNLFFPILTALMILQASLAKTERSVLINSAMAGLSLFFFLWWWEKAGFALAFFVVLVISLFIQQIRIRTILLSILLFVLCTDPKMFMHSTSEIHPFFKTYIAIDEVKTEIFIEEETTPASFPNVLTTIGEVSRYPAEWVFRRILSNPLFGWAGFLAISILAILRWRVLIPLLPMLILGGLSFQSSIRFIMFLAPFIGIGLGLLLSIVIGGLLFLLFTKIIKKNISSNGKGNKLFDWARQVVLYLVMFLFFWGISEQTAISYVPGPSINPRIYETFLEVKNRVPEDSALLTWWDFGYSIIDATGLATFHDGGTQNLPKTYFIARSLISPDQGELYDITQYLATEGNRGIWENNTSPEDLLQAVRNPQQKPWDPIYLFFTADMTGKYQAISKLGSWDIVKGGSKPSGYQKLSCNKITNEEMNCRGAKIDLKAGKINNQVPLKRSVFIRDGRVLREKEFGNVQGYTLQMLVSGQRIVEVQLMDEVVFRSNYNQMFLLGRYRDDLYEQTYNAFPFSRLFRVKF